MSATVRETNGRAEAPPAMYTPEQAYEPVPENGAGWLAFATVMLSFAGIVGLMYGIVAITKASFFVGDARFVFSGLSTWGWIVTGIGAVTLLAALSVRTRAQWARWTGMVVAGLQGIAQLLMIQAYPFWSLAIFALDVLVIYALAVYGGRRAEGT